MSLSYRMVMMVATVVGACGRGSQAAHITSKRPTAILRDTFTIDGDGDGAVAAKAADVMRRRFERLANLGIEGIAAHAEGERIVVEMHALDADAIARVRDIASRRGQLTLHLVDTDASPMAQLAAYVAEDPDAAQSGIRVSPEMSNDSSERRNMLDVHLMAEDRRESFTDAEARAVGCWHKDAHRGLDGRIDCQVAGRQVIDRYVMRAASDARLAFPANRVLIYGKVPPSSWRTFYAERADRFAGVTILGTDVCEVPGGWQVSLTVDATGEHRLREMTGAHTSDNLAIVLDDVVLSAPIPMTAITNGRVALTAVDRRDAEDLAIVLASGALPEQVMLSRSDSAE